MQLPVAPVSIPQRCWQEVRPRRGYERLLWLSSGDPWTGAVSWRKPVVFGFSFGVTLLSMAWVLGRVPTARRLGWIVAAGLVGSSLAEVGLITMQRWRGVASHFNFATDFDAAVFASMGVAISVFAVLSVVVLGWAALRASAGPARIAAVGGLLLLVAAQGLGGPLIAEGSAVAQSSGVVPDQVTVGARGVGKLAHGVGIHALQVLAVLAVLVDVGSLSRAVRRRIMLTAVTGNVLLLGWALAQTYLGRAPVDLTPALAAWLLCGGGLLVGAYGWAVVGLRSAGLPAVRSAEAAAGEVATVAR